MRRDLKTALAKFPPGKGNDLLDLILESNRVLRHASWDDIISLIEEVTGDDLTARRPPKCDKCGSVLYINGRCESCTENLEKEES